MKQNILIFCLSIFMIFSCSEDSELVNTTSIDQFDATISKISRTCTSSEHNEKLIKNIDYQQRLFQRISKTRAYINTRSESDLNAQLVIPVAVHFQDVQGTNLSCLREIARRQIDILNEDFSGTNSDISNWNSFKSDFPNVQTGNAKIKFCLADINHPIGYGLSNGDIAVTLNVTNGDFDSSWSGYLNIWVRPDLGGLGYSPLGGEGNGDGVSIEAEAFGSGSGCGDVRPYSPFNLGRTLTHEVGHFLFLDHIWGDEESCNNDDNINDTPSQREPNYDCPSGTLRSCNTNDLYMNYMDYVDDACMWMFTTGQTNVMNNYVSANFQSMISKAATVCSEMDGDGGNQTDQDNDGVVDADDNCPSLFNPNQEDSNNNGIGDVCDSEEEGCISPQNLKTTDIKSNSISVSWGKVSNANTYIIALKEIGVPGWTRNRTSDEFYTFNNLKTNTDYKIQVRSICPDQKSPWTSIQTTTSLNGECTEIVLSITLDDYPEETGWVIYDEDDNIIFTKESYPENNPGATVNEEFCLEEGCYYLEVTDLYGDGICCEYGEGSFELKDQNKVIYYSDGYFGAYDGVYFCVGNANKLRVKQNKSKKNSNLALKPKR